jgi:signal transduction histidine kinase
VILDRLTVRERVNLLALFPLLLVVVMSVPLVAARLDDARTARETAQAATTAAQVSRLIELTQQLRILAVSFQGRSGMPPNAVAGALQSFADERDRLSDLESVQSRAHLARALDDVKDLQAVTSRVLAGNLIGTDILDAYGTRIDTLINALGFAGDLGANRVGGTSLSALDALLRSDEADSRRSAALLLALIDPASRSQAIPAAQELEIVESTGATQFVRSVGPRVEAQLTQVTHSLAALRLAGAKIWLLRSAKTAEAPTLTAEVYAAAQDQMLQRRFLESTVIRDLSGAARRDLQTAWSVTAGLALVGLSVLLGAIALSIVVGRSVSRPLRGLTTAAGRVADLAQEELLRVADEDSTEARVPRLAAIDVRSEDEIGDLAEAFNRVQTTAALLLERQVTSRRNVAAMFASMGRRTSNLVNRQLTLIDALEREEEDPDTLATLFRLDHTATRLRRNASSLVVLSGGSESLGEGQPVPIGDVLRAALGTVEDYQRVELRRLPKVRVAPGVIGDLALLLAELLDNAVSFSPPRSQVEVVGTTSRDGTCTLSVIDHGMGMPLARMSEENGRLRRRERLDLAPSDVLGLFVVGRIARRHRIDVRLEVTPPTGVTAVVRLPSSLLVDGRAVSGGQPAPGADARQRQAVAAAAATRRQLATRASSPIPPAPVPPAPVPPAPVPPAPVPPAPVPTSAALPDGTLPQRVGGVNREGVPLAPPQPATPGSPAAPASPPPGPPPPPGGEGIARRVPGAHLADLDIPLSPPKSDPITVRLTIDPERVRRQILDVEQAVDRAEQVAQGVDVEPVLPPVAEVARRSGISRRVPGAALANLDGALPAPGGSDPALRHPSEAEPGAGAGIDAEHLRSELNAVDQALQQAHADDDTGSITAERLAAQEAEAARRAAAGRHEEQRATIAALADGLTTGSVLLPGAPAATEAPVTGTAAPDTPVYGIPQAPTTPAPTTPAPTTPAPTTPEPVEPASAAAPSAERPESAPLARRVRGASLASFVSGGAPPRHAAGSNSSWGLRSGPLAVVPEQPEDVLGWASDLEATMARVPGSDGRLAEAGAGNVGSERTAKPSGQEGEGT